MTTGSGNGWPDVIKVPSRLIGWSREVGKRVQMRPHTDEWMSGDRYGVITRHDIEMERFSVLLDKSGRKIVVDAEDVEVLP